MFSSPRGLSVTEYWLVNVKEVQALSYFDILDFNEFRALAILLYSFKRKRFVTGRSKRHVIYNINANDDYETKIVFR